MYSMLLVMIVCVLREIAHSVLENGWSFTVGKTRRESKGNKFKKILFGLLDNEIEF